MQKTMGVIVLISAMAAVAAPITIVQDSFEYDSQAAFEAVWPAIGTSGTTSNVLTSDKAATGSKSLLNPSIGTNGSYRNRITFAETQATVAEPLTFKFMIYDTAPTANPQRGYVNLQDTTAPSGSGQLLALGFNNNLLNSAAPGPRYMARVLGYNGGAYFKLDGDGVPARSEGWHELRVDISPTTYQFYVDGVAAQSVPVTTNRSYDNIAIGSGLSSTQTTYFDDVSLIQLPEPTTLMCLGFAGLLLGRRRRA